MQPDQEFENANLKLFQAIVEQAPDAIIFADRDGAVTGALAIGRDCTTRYRSDSALRARVLELEEKLEIASKSI